MKKLTRLKVGEFDIENSITLEEFNANYQNSDFLNSHFIEIEKFFEKKEKIELSKIENDKINNNNIMDKFLNGVKLEVNKSDEIYRIYNNDTFIGISEVINGILKRDIVI